MSGFLAVPESVRKLFARFPIVTYDAGESPQRATGETSAHVLYVFVLKDHLISFNPSCLRLQALLKFNRIPHEVRASNNNASPSGSLPFLLPNDATNTPVTSTRLARWISAQNGREEIIRPKQDAFASLIDHDLRNAWLYYLYLEPANFQIAFSLYCESASSNILVQHALGRQLKVAATDELLKSFQTIDSSELYERAADAFRALSSLLGDDEHFFGPQEPGLFDASVFAYTHLLLDAEMAWQTTTLTDLLKEHSNLIRHRDRLMTRYFD